MFQEVTSWTTGKGSTMAAAGGAIGVFEPHGTTARLARAVFLRACDASLQGHIETKGKNPAAGGCKQPKQAPVPVKSRWRMGVAI